MKKFILFLLLTGIIGITGLTACVTETPVAQSNLPIPQNSDSIVLIEISDRGIATHASEVVIKNFHAGARAEMPFAIYNNSTRTIVPEFYFVEGADITTYSKANGAVKAPDHVKYWLELPETNTLQQRETGYYIIALQMPEEVEKLADKIGFLVGISNTVKGNIQPAVGVWWIVNMR